MNLQWSWIQSALRLILRHPICGVVMVPVLADDRIVLVRRRDNGCWSLPGGMVEWGEDIPTTIVRELQEETGLKVTQIGRGIFFTVPRSSISFDLYYGRGHG
jgi:8-oxo-dGTP diphosphatase